MAVKDYSKHDVESFEDWYVQYRVTPEGRVEHSGFAECSLEHSRRHQYYKTEMDTRVKNYYKYEKQAAAEVVTERRTHANISSGDSASFLDRVAKNIVQHTPNVTLVNEFKHDSIAYQLSMYFLRHKIIGDDEYSNDMQQNLLSSVETALTIGFDCVIPVLQQNSAGSWYTQYDNIHYRDVYPEPGAKDVRRANDVYVRRYLTRSQIKGLIRSQAVGWDIPALRSLLKTVPASREYVDHESKKHSVNPEAYEVITWYSNTGAPFLTFDARGKLLLRIEKNKHPLGEHPVFFLVLKRDAQQPLGKSILAKTFGRQEFQDLYLNGAMKLLAKNIDPPIFAYGTANAVPNLSPGKFNPISNPQARVESFEVNSSSLQMFGNMAALNAANMGQLIGAADQQMAAQSTGGMMSQTPQGVDAQQQMVTTTTGDFQRSVEAFFSRYLSYALTVYLQEMKNIKKMKPDAAAREALLNGGLPPESFQEDGTVEVPLDSIAVIHHVKIIPGSLAELEEEKQIRLLNQMFVPLSQAMPALSATNDPAMLANAAAAMQFIILKQIELSGSDHSRQLQQLMTEGNSEEFQEEDDKLQLLAEGLGGVFSDISAEAELQKSLVSELREQVELLTSGLGAVAGALGLPRGQIAGDAATGGGSATPAPTPPPAVV